MKSPMVSVIMSVYNEPAEWIMLAIDSVLHQTYRDVEFIIVCDNPDNDSICNLLSNYMDNDTRIVLILNKTNIGLTRSLNVALHKCKGKYIARMDADDISFPNRFEK